MIRVCCALGALVASACTPGASPRPVPTTTVTPPAPVPSDAAVNACTQARQHMDELECPPEEDAAGGWIAECSALANEAQLTSCITRQTTCLGTRQCPMESDR